MRRLTTRKRPGCSRLGSRRSVTSKAVRTERLALLFVRRAALADAPRLRLTFDLIMAGADSVERCTGEGRVFELGRLDEGGIVHRVDGVRPFTCGRAVR